MLSRGCVLNMAPYRGVVSPSTVTWHDASRYHNDGTLTNVTWTRLPSGLWVAGFNGTTSFINVADNGGLNITARPLTIAVWVKPASDAVTCYFFCRNTDAIANIQYAVLWDLTAPLMVNCRLEGVTRASSGSNSVPVSSWTLCGFTWSAAGVPQCYVNGAASGSAGASFTSTLTSRANINVGCRATATSFFKGDMWGWRILPVEWSVADWSRTFSSERRLFGI